MITPIIIQLVFWVMVVIVLLGVLFVLRELVGTGGVLLTPIVAVPILVVVRVYAEILIVAFKINDSLTDINHTLTEIKNQGTRGSGSFASRAEGSAPRGGSRVTPVAGRRVKTCPYCAESIFYEEVKCRFCGSDVPNEPGSSQ